MHKLTLLVSAAAILPAQDFDILIRNGRIVDGTGNPSFMGDVGIKDKRIAALGRISGKTAARTIDANGLVVAPGFIDMHNHSDEAILSDGNPRKYDSDGCHVNDPRRGLFSGANGQLPALSRLLGGCPQKRCLDEYRFLYRIRFGLPSRSWSKAWPGHPRRNRAGCEVLSSRPWKMARSGSPRLCIKLPASGSRLTSWWRWQRSPPKMGVSMRAHSQRG